MGGFFGAVAENDVILDVFFGTDYHSHLGTRRGGMAACDKEIGLQREIHNIENSPFRTKFQNVTKEMKGNAAIGIISDYDPQPLLIRSNLGVYAIAVIGVINNREALIERCLDSNGGFFNSMTGGNINNTELVAALINQKSDFAAGIQFAQAEIDGTCSLLILTNDGTIIAARDKLGRLPVILGKSENAHCVSFESFVTGKLGFEKIRELGPAEIVEISARQIKVLHAPEKKKRICSFLWSYYGYPTSTYEGVNVEMMRYRNGAILAQNDAAQNATRQIDYVGGVPDSGTPHAIGYANESKLPFARAFIKYTPTWSRSFIPTKQEERNKIAKMKQIPVHDLIKDKNLLYENGAASVHVRSACPPIMYGCKYLNFSRATSDMDLIARKVIMELEGESGFDYIDEYIDGTTDRGKALRKCICEKLHLASLEFQSLGGIIDAIGIDESEVCTYCWNGKE